MTAKQVSNGQVIGSLQVHVEHLCSTLWSRRTCGRCEMCALEPTSANNAKFRESLLGEEHNPDRRAKFKPRQPERLDVRQQEGRLDRQIAEDAPH